VAILPVKFFALALSQQDDLKTEARGFYRAIVLPL